MPAQPFLLLLQNTILMAEGLGRGLDDGVNMWTIARPLIEDWMIQNRGPDARLAASLSDVQKTLVRTPRILARADAIGEREVARQTNGSSLGWQAC